ncbi:hypothetical protein [Mucilaginibacter sp. HD30]
MDDILKRITTGIELLKDGFPYKVGELYLGFGDGYFNITGNSQSIDLKNITEGGALKEMEEIKRMFENMLSVSSDLKDLIRDKKLKFSLDFDYGMGSIRICSEIDNVLKWEMEST